MVATRRFHSLTGASSKKAKLNEASPPIAPSPPRLLFSLNNPSTPLLNLIPATLIARPSKHNRSPYVADVYLTDEKREAIAHVPNLDMCGKCVPGSKMLIKPATDGKGILVGRDGKNKLYGTPKCEFIAQLVFVDETEVWEGYKAVWVGAHPNLGERIAEHCILNNLMGASFNSVTSLKRQIVNPCGANMRSDFYVELGNGDKKIVEVKMVSDSDYFSGFVPVANDSDKNKKKKNLNNIVTTAIEPYTRTALFPLGNSNQKGPDGEKVLSARAINHVIELTKIANGGLKDFTGDKFESTIIFVIVRGDCKTYTPNMQSDPTFCKYLKIAHDEGVEILVKNVYWGDGDVGEIGSLYDSGMGDLVWATASSN